MGSKQDNLAISPIETIENGSAIEFLGVITSFINILVLMAPFIISMVSQPAGAETSGAAFSHGSVGIAFLAIVPISLNDAVAFSKPGILEEAQLSHGKGRMRACLHIACLLAVFASIGGIACSFFGTETTDLITVLLVVLVFCILGSVFAYRLFLVFKVAQIRNSVPLQDSIADGEGDEQ